MKHPCAVVGQSNSILHYGFVRKLVERESIELVASARLGASPSVTAHMFLSPGFFRDARFCIFDVCVMDTTYWFSGAARAIDLVRWVESALQACQAAGVIPLMVTIPHQVAANRFWLAEMYADLCRELGGACLDVSRLLHQRSETTGELVASMYVDPSHVNTEVSAEIAGCLEAYMDSCVATEREFQFLKRRFDAVTLGGTPRRNSLVEWTFANLVPGTVLDVDIGVADRVSAVIFDGASSCGRLSIRGSGTVVKDLTTVHVQSGHNFLLVASPLLAPVRDVSGKLSLSLTEEPATEHTFQHVSDDRSPSVDVGGIIVERPTEACRVVGLAVEQSEIPISPAVVRQIFGADGAKRGMMARRVRAKSSNRLPGVVETTTPAIAGWVSQAGSGVSEVALHIDGDLLVNLRAECERPDVLRNVGYRGAAFSFTPSPSLLAEISQDSVLTVTSGGVPLLMATGVSANIGHAAPGCGRLSQMLRDGHVVSAKSGTLYRPIGTIEGWREKISALYTDARQVFRDELGHELFVFYGSLLGLVRDGDFMPRDDDFDAAFVVEAADCEELGARFVEVGDRLEAMGWCVVMFPSGNMHLRRADSAAALDIFVLGLVGGRLIGYELNSPMPKSSMAPAALTKLGTTWTVPKDADHVLEAIYGPKWRTPDPAFQWRRAPETARSMKALDAEIRRRLDQKVRAG